MNARWSGSTHDSVAFTVSNRAQKLCSTRLPSGYWISADPTYMCVNSFVTPWSASSLRGEMEVFCDALNFYHSSHRMLIEQACGILVRLWGAFWNHCPSMFSSCFNFLLLQCAYTTTQYKLTTCAHCLRLLLCMAMNRLKKHFKYGGILQRVCEIIPKTAVCEEI